jgi:tetratricopeptide (TPR) repeat protein
MNIRVICCFLLVGLMSSLHIHANSIDSLLSETMNPASNMNPELFITLAANEEISLEQRMHFVDRALHLADSFDHYRYYSHALLYKALIYRHYSNYSKSLSYYQDLVDHCKQYHLDSLLGESYYLIGVLYRELDNEDLAVQYFHEALSVLVKQNHRHAIGNTYHSLGSSMLVMGYEAEGLNYIKKSLKMLTDRPIMLIAPLNSIGLYYSDQQNYDSAITYFELALQYSIELNHFEGSSIFNMNLGDVYFACGDKPKARKFFESSLDFALQSENPHTIASAHKNLAIYNFEMKEYASAYLHLEKSSMIRDSIIDVMKVEQMRVLEDNFTHNSINDELAEKEDYIEFLKEEDRTKMQLLVLVGTITLLLFIIGVLIRGRYLRRIRNEEQKSQMQLSMQRMEADLYNIERELYQNQRKSLEDELKYKGQILSSLGTDIAVKNDLINSFRVDLKEMKKLNENEKGLRFNAWILKFDQHFKINEQLEEYQQNLEQNTKELSDQLKRKYPSLTNKEVKLCGMLRLGLSSKEIANLWSISVHSVDVYRYRIRKKMMLESNEKLVDALSGV